MMSRNFEYFDFIDNQPNLSLEEKTSIIYRCIKENLDMSSITSLSRELVLSLTYKILDKQESPQDNTNYISMLNEKLQAILGRSPSIENIKYSKDITFSDGVKKYQAIISINIPEALFHISSGEWFVRQKDAEQCAAKKCIDKINSIRVI